MRPKKNPADKMDDSQVARLLVVKAIGAPDPAGHSEGTLRVGYGNLYDVESIIVSLLPTVRSRKPSDGLAGALLLADYGRRRSATVWDSEGPPLEATL